MYEVTYSDPQNPQLFTGPDFAKAYPDLAQFAFTLPINSEVQLTSEHGNGEPFSITVKVIEPDRAEVIQTQVWIGFNLEQLIRLSRQGSAVDEFYPSIMRGIERLQAQKAK